MQEAVYAMATPDLLQHTVSRLENVSIDDGSTKELYTHLHAKIATAGQHVQSHTPRGVLVGQGR
jgi:hypothetical protein